MSSHRNVRIAGALAVARQLREIGELTAAQTVEQIVAGYAAASELLDHAAKISPNAVVGSAVMRDALDRGVVPDWMEQHRLSTTSTMCPGCGQNRTLLADGTFAPHHTAHNGVDGPVCDQGAAA